MKTGCRKVVPSQPVLSNIYLHYVLDLWFERRFKKTCRNGRS